MEQMNFLPETNTESLDSRINHLKTKIKNIRMGLFKRYEEQKRAIEFLEGEIEGLVKENIDLFGTYQ
jgi:uncharacterized protein YfkK (UPF0435 family)